MTQTPRVPEPVAPRPATTGPSARTTPTDLADRAQPKPDYFGANTVKGPGSVKEAISAMQRYTALMEKHTKLVGERDKVADQARAAQAENVKLKADLAQARRECDEANAMLQRLSADLRTWKRDVLGNRQEIMASLTKLQSRQEKILQVLLGEMPSSVGAFLISSIFLPSSSRTGTSSTSKGNPPVTVLSTFESPCA